MDELKEIKRVLRETRNMLLDLCPMYMKGDEKLKGLLDDIEKHLK